MGGKRKKESQDEVIRRKIKKLEEKLEKPRRKRVLVYTSSEDESSCSYESGNNGCHEEVVTPTSNLSTVAMIHEPPSEPAQDIQEVPSQPSASQEVSEDVELDEEILNLLGDAPSVKTSLGKNIHKEIASRWQELLCNGLSKENRDKICQDYLAPANCDLLVAPTLNPEAKAALTEFIVKRDQSLLQKQKQIGTALAALSRATELIIAKETPEKVLKPLSDACRLLCDSHYQDTKTRRNFVLSAVKPELKDTLINTTRNQFLFGENLSEQIKCAKNIQKSGEGLKITQKHPMFDKNKFIKNKNNQTQKTNLNFRAPYRKAPPGKLDAGRSQPAAQRWMRSRQANQDRDRDRSPPPQRRGSPPRRGRK